ncbi:egg cell-secreted protein 1.4-like [Magnolia sinica]|uniref:egg cell-secreted protein 1.4-like n=1 Tax=Magnolia sinica TaxID=86752 RepID=UPI002658F470|nr:egg cell-secreted protein 1.4-like [Magnolia sinica]
MEFSKLFLYSILSWVLLSSDAVARPMPYEPNLAARLEVGSVECWDSLVELQACTTEVILFFLNGETSLGPGCCRAIRIIEHQCWPTMLSSLGFTAEECDILRGYCNASVSLPPPSLPTQGPGIVPDSDCHPGAAPQKNL